MIGKKVFQTFDSCVTQIILFTYDVFKILAHFTLALNREPVMMVVLSM